METPTSTTMPCAGSIGTSTNTISWPWWASRGTPASAESPPCWPPATTRSPSGLARVPAGSAPPALSPRRTASIVRDVPSRNVVAWDPFENDEVSFAIPVVSAEAATLEQVARYYSYSAGTNAAVIKAIIMASASKNPLPSWAHTPTAPLDPQWGAGQVNFDWAYQVMTAGPQHRRHHQPRGIDRLELQLAQSRHFLGKHADVLLAGAQRTALRLVGIADLGAQCVLRDQR